MCFEIMAVASTMVKATGEAKVGAERKKQAYEKAAQIDQDAEIAGIESKQKSRAMFEQYLQDSNANEAWFSYLGIEDSASINAFKKRQKELINEQELRRRTQDNLNQAKLRSEANTLRASGRSALLAGKIGAISSFGTGIYNINQQTDIMGGIEFLTTPFNLID